MTVDTNSVSGAFVLFGLVLTILAIPLQFGYYWCVLTFSRKKDFSVKDIVDPYTSGDSFVKTLGTGIMVGIFITLWTLLLIIPGIIKTFSYAMTPYILKDNSELGVFEAITKSRRMMDGNKWRLFLLFLSFIGWYLLVIVTLGLAIFWVGPYLEVATACFYNEVKKKYEEKESFHQSF